MDEVISLGRNVVLRGERTVFLAANCLTVRTLHRISNQSQPELGHKER
jgi:hypothetical protein